MDDFTQTCHTRRIEQVQADSDSSGTAEETVTVSPALRAPLPEVQTLEEVVELVRASASEVLQQEFGPSSHFAAGHVDSLSAVELSNKLGRALGLSLPGTNIPVI